jgi:hypothetical protein
MGTSNSYGGPKGGSPLLPPWADEGELEIITGLEDEDAEKPEVSDTTNPPIDQQQEVPLTISTLPVINGSQKGIARAEITRYTRIGGIPRIKSALSAHIQSKGGSRGATISAVSGKRHAKKIAKFFSNIANNGVESALGEIGISQFEGKSAVAVILQIADALSPQGSSLEESITRHAVVDTLTDIYTEFGIDAEGIQKLNSLTEENIIEIMHFYISNYIFGRFLLEVQRSIERSEITPSQAIDIESQIKQYIYSNVELKFKKIKLLKTRWDSREGIQIVNSIFLQAYKILEIMK